MTPTPTQAVDGQRILRRAHQLRRRRQLLTAAPIVLVIAVLAGVFGLTRSNDGSTNVRTSRPEASAVTPTTEAPSLTTVTTEAPGSTTTVAEPVVSTTTTTVAPVVSATATEGDLTATMTLDRTELNVGEPVTMTLHVTDPTGELDFAIALFGDSSTGPLMANGCGTQGDSGQGGVEWTGTATHTFEQPGTYEVVGETQTIAPTCEGTIFERVRPAITIHVR